MVAGKSVKDKVNAIYEVKVAEHYGQGCLELWAYGSTGNAKDISTLLEITRLLEILFPGSRITICNESAYLDFWNMPEATGWLEALEMTEERKEELRKRARNEA